MQKNLLKNSDEYSEEAVSSLQSKAPKLSVKFKQFDISKLAYSKKRAR